MRLIAHRGLGRCAPENTLAAFASALSVGFHGIETDVRLSVDGELILFHDRLSRLGLPVAAMTRTELSQSEGYLVPTLAEALEAFPDALWNIELKAPPAAVPLCSLLKQMSGKRQVIVTSLRHEIMPVAAETLQLECGLIVWHRPIALNTLLYAAMPYPRLRILVWHYEAIELSLLQQANALGFRNYIFGAQTEHEHAICAELGMHGIITDYPEFVGLEYATSLQ
ncbi:glycerophosphoryl diester phosphodiesterase [Chitiniphilus shinanonensis]|uniref:Glycerophosphoryl diester phosphodiesterase n=1 Tax=Chitiniphilus shinanonensis TaxID=553088 RepID=A0ABQ6BYU7_9NEIS|nr:glycerophosphodiester phosphodiesterase [Chitiniphilus shinanonensis]GLS04869.1 glycerophosphoryl diester phosphodiesterase [Chitiniphilus shinanonensis]